MRISYAQVSSTGITEIVDESQEKLVRKTATNPKQIEKLEQQYQWLQTRERLAHLPRVVHFEKTASTAALYLEYCENAIPLFDFIHSHSIDQSERLISAVLDFLDAQIHQPVKKRQAPKVLHHYVTEKVTKKLEEFAAAAPRLRELVQAKRLVINGEEYENIPTLVERVGKSGSRWSSLSSEHRCEVHGDVTVANILVRQIDAKPDFVLIDPNGENYFSDPLVDYSKLYQSLHSGYEFLCRMDQVVLTGANLTFDARISPEYTQLFASLQNSLRARLSEDRFGCILFHEAVHFTRLLPYKTSLGIGPAALFYATAVRLFNEALR